MDAQDSFEYIEKGSFSHCFTMFDDMRRNGDLCDVTIKAGHESFPAHRVILASVIPYFKTMFTSQFAERFKREIIMEDVDSASLQSLIGFAYTGRLFINTDNVAILLETSVYLQHEGVTNACFEFLLKRLRPDTVMIIFTFADYTNHLSAKESAERFVQENFEDFCRSEEFLHLSYEILKKMISRDDLFVTREQVVFEAVVKWVNAERSARLVFLPELMRHVRLPLLTADYVKNHASFGELIGASSSCEEVLNAVIRCCSKELDSSVSQSLILLERYCKPKHHLKCANLTGSSMYSVIRSEGEEYCIKYYDSIYRRWENLYRLPEYKYKSYVVCLEDNIHLIHRMFICTLNLKTMTFTSLKGEYDIPDFAGIVSHHNSIYFVGGNGDCSTLVQQFFPQSGSFIVTGTLVVGRLYSCAVSIGNNIYTTGGHPHSYNQRSAEVFNPTTGQSSEISSMLVSRYFPACAPVNDKMYVCGGMTEGMVELTWNFRYSLTAEVYDPSIDEWRFITPMSRSMARFKLFPYAGKLYAVNYAWMEKAEIYDPENDTWDSIEFVPETENNERLITVATGTESL